MSLVILVAFQYFLFVICKEEKEDLQKKLLLQHLSWLKDVAKTS